MLPAREAEIAQGKADRAVHKLCSRLQNGRKLKIVELLLINEEIMPRCNDKQSQSITLPPNFKNLSLDSDNVIVSSLMSQVADKASWLAWRRQVYDQRLEVLSLCLQHVTLE